MAPSTFREYSDFDTFSDYKIYLASKGKKIKVAKE